MLNFLRETWWPDIEDPWHATIISYLVIFANECISTQYIVQDFSYLYSIVHKAYQPRECLKSLVV